MQICISSTGQKLDSIIDPRFGRAQYFLFLDEKGKLKEAIANQGVSAMRGAGITAAQTVASKGAKVLITGNVGPNAFNVLQASNIKIFLASVSVTAAQAFSQWKENKLEEAKQSNVAGHFGMGGGMGRGGGFGRGRL